MAKSAPSAEEPVFTSKCYLRKGVQSSVIRMAWAGSVESGQKVLAVLMDLCGPLKGHLIGERLDRHFTCMANGSEQVSEQRKEMFLLFSLC